MRNKGRGEGRRAVAHVVLVQIVKVDAVGDGLVLEEGLDLAEVLRVRDELLGEDLLLALRPDAPAILGKRRLPSRA